MSLWDDCGGRTPQRTGEAAWGLHDVLTRLPDHFRCGDRNFRTVGCQRKRQYEVITCTTISALAAINPPKPLVWFGGLGWLGLTPKSYRVYRKTLRIWEQIHNPVRSFKLTECFYQNYLRWKNMVCSTSQDSLKFTPIGRILWDWGYRGFSKTLFE